MLKKITDFFVSISKELTSVLIVLIILASPIIAFGYYSKSSKLLTSLRKICTLQEDMIDEIGNGYSINKYNYHQYTLIIKECNQ